MNRVPKVIRAIGALLILGIVLQAAISLSFLAEINPPAVFLGVALAATWVAVALRWRRGLDAKVNRPEAELAIEHRLAKTELARSMASSDLANSEGATRMALCVLATGKPATNPAEMAKFVADHMQDPRFTEMARAIVQQLVAIKTRSGMQGLDDIRPMTWASEVLEVLDVMQDEQVGVRGFLSRVMG